MIEATRGTHLIANDLTIYLNLPSPTHEQHQRASANLRHGDSEELHLHLVLRSMNSTVFVRHDMQLWFFHSQEEVKQFRLQVEMHCRCKGCIRKVDKAMMNIGSFSGIWTSVADVDAGTVTVVGKVNPTEVCHWLKKKTKKNIKVVSTDSPIDNHTQKMIYLPENSSKTGSALPSAPPLPQMSSAVVPFGVQSEHESLEVIEEKIRGLETVRNKLKIKNLENELIVAKRELKQSRKVIDSSKKALLDSALNQLKAYKDLEILSHN
ncbi:hypothetical protein ACP4OV_025565 [Aristida adscensionis]